MYPQLNLDGFDTLSAQPNSPNESITSKSQLIMMAFSIRSIGKCTHTDNSRCSDSVEYIGDIAGNSELIFVWFCLSFEHVYY